MYLASFIIFCLLASVALLATVLPLFPFKQWYFRVFDYPRLQTFFMAVAALVIYLTLLHRKGVVGVVIIALLGSIIIIQASKAIPYTIFGTKQVPDSLLPGDGDSQVGLFICNVLQSNTAHQKLLNSIHQYNPDIIITTETDKRWEKTLQPLDDDYPYSIKVPQSNKYGMHLYSRFPLRNESVRYLVEPDIPSIHTQVQLKTGNWIDLFVVHPRPPVPGEDNDSKERDAEILMVGKQAKKSPGGVIVAGDFNDVAWSRTTARFQEVTGFLDPRRGRGFYNTYHAKVPVFRWPLDHLFHSGHFKLFQIERGASVNSDHFPMYVNLSYEP